MINIEYDEKENRAYAKKSFLGDTVAYIGIAKICPKCRNYIEGYPAISRRDNRTEICSNCGTIEALEDFIKY